jgi:type II secretory pathway predicted ATPase ExeA
MYESFFGLRESPFSLVPDPEYLYLSRFHRKGLNMLELAMRDSAMFTLISGEVGSGKTTLVRKFLGMLDDNVSIGLITNTHESAGNMTQWILRSFGLRFGKDDEVELYDRFQEFLFEQYENQRKTMLIIDEAQNLSPASLEELRMLSNINTEKDLALQIVLVGQPEILEKINLPELRQLAQRISVNFRLEPLSFVETCHYIRHRIKVAGGRPDIFDLNACAAVYLFSDGIPRVINMICEMAMIYAYGDGQQTITAETILDVVDERRRSGIGGMSSLTKAYDRSAIEDRIRELIEQESAAAPEPVVVPDAGAPEPVVVSGVSAPELAVGPAETVEAESPASPFAQRRSATELPDREWEPGLDNEEPTTRASVMPAPHLKPIFAESEPEQEPPTSSTHAKAKKPSFPFSRRRPAMELPDRKWEQSSSDEEPPMKASVLQTPHFKPIFTESEPEQEPPPPSIPADPGPADPGPADLGPSDPDSQVEPGKKEPRGRRRFVMFVLLIIGVGILGLYPLKSSNINKLPDLLKSYLDPKDSAETEVAPGEETLADLAEASGEQKDTGTSEAMSNTAQDEPSGKPRYQRRRRSISSPRRAGRSGRLGELGWGCGR